MHTRDEVRNRRSGCSGRQVAFFFFCDVERVRCWCRPEISERVKKSNASAWHGMVGVGVVGEGVRVESWCCC